jgi:hypothetical protein
VLLPSTWTPTVLRARPQLPLSPLQADVWIVPTSCQRTCATWTSARAAWHALIRKVPRQQPSVPLTRQMSGVRLPPRPPWSEAVFLGLRSSAANNGKPTDRARQPVRRPLMAGHKRFRAVSWRLTVETPPDPIAGERQQVHRTGDLLGHDGAEHVQPAPGLARSRSNRAAHCRRRHCGRLDLSSRGRSSRALDLVEVVGAPHVRGECG